MQFFASPTPKDIFESALKRYPELRETFSGEDSQELKELAIQILAKDHTVCKKMYDQTHKINAMIRNIRMHRRALQFTDRLVDALYASGGVKACT